MATQSLTQLWAEIERSGGIENYIQQQLRERGFLIERKETKELSKKELREYKKSLKTEAANRRELKKQAWLAYRASHIVHLGESVYWNDADDFDRWDLEHAEKRAAENDLPQLEKPAHLAAALKISIEELRWLTYHREAAKNIHYIRFTIPKRTGREREIWAPLPKLKAIQRWILSEILEHIPVHGAAHGFLPGRSILTNAGRHTDSKIVLRVDLKDFFPTITFRRVKGVFRKAGYREQIATLLALLSTEAPRKIVRDGAEEYFVSLGPRCLPQGAPTSPAITNVVCMRLDRRLTGLAEKNGWRYTRYADDLTLSLPATHSGRPGVGRLLEAIRRIVEAEGFRVHQKKTFVARKGGRQRVSGFTVNGPGEPRVPRKLKRMLRAAIHNAKQGRDFKDGDFLRRMVGFAAYTYMAEPEPGARFLDELRRLESAAESTPDPEK